jgi:hypothetical protein
MTRSFAYMASIGQLHCPPADATAAHANHTSGSNVD